MPDWGIVARALSGYCFAIIFLLYEQLGKPCYAKERQGLEQTIADLNTHIEDMVKDYSTKIEDLTRSHSIEVTRLTGILETQNRQVNLLAEKATSLELQGLDSYPKVQKEWIEKGVKTCSIGEIELVTGLSRQRINAAIRANKLQKDNRNKELIRVSSVVEWLKTIPAPVIETNLSNGQFNGLSNGHSTDTEALNLQALNVSIES